MPYPFLTRRTARKHCWEISWKTDWKLPTYIADNRLRSAVLIWDYNSESAKKRVIEEFKLDLTANIRTRYWG